MDIPASDPNPRRENVVTYDSPYPIYAMAFSAANPRRIAVGSFLEELNNRVEILSFSDDSSSLKPVPSLSFDHPYPPTKLLFHPSSSPSQNLLASSGDYLRLWEIKESSIEPFSTLNNSKTSEYCAPLTSFDWNEVEPKRIGTSSIDTTCTIWDIEKGVVETQLIAHDKEVYDIAWGEAGVFASVSADGSVRIFDLRDKEHSTIIYESPTPDTPLLRLAWNKQDLRYMATTLMDSNKIVILDIRSPTIPVAELERHVGSVNAIAWAPHSARHICSAGDDGQALLWELPTVAGPNGIDPILMYGAGGEINQLQWSASQQDWIAVAFGNKMQMLKRPPPDMPPPPPLPPPHHHHHHHLLLKKPTPLSDVIFTAFSLLILFSTAPKPASLFFIPNKNQQKLSFSLNTSKFPKMSLPFRNPSRHPPPPFATPQSLSDWLKPRLSADLFGAWGKPGTKNVHNLWLEIAQGETLLADSNPPVRTVEVVVVRIIRNDGKVLVESHQELSDGAVRHRGRPLSEKMKPGESVEVAVNRAVKEELGSIIKIESLENSDGNDESRINGIVRILAGSYVKKVEERHSASYPGLPACYVLHKVDAEVEGLPENEFCTEEVDEYGDLEGRGVADCAVSCKKHYWKWVDSDSI
ncbi:hypothetical protein ACJIZ3_022606 [Penstemon smallii]|uniref:Uncharacterized protein n=1 Tax=Penstemon smallii TaxID=265156 RepID=A0ABD3TNV0_9LAMI